VIIRALSPMMLMELGRGDDAGRGSAVGGPDRAEAATRDDLVVRERRNNRAGRHDLHAEDAGRQVQIIKTPAAPPLPAHPLPARRCLASSCVAETICPSPVYAVSVTVVLSSPGL